MATFYCRIRNLKVKDLNKVDTRIICAEGLDWRIQASEFRDNLWNNVEKNLLTISHDYPVVGAYNLVDIPISNESNVLVFSNGSNKLDENTSYKISFYNSEFTKLRTVIVETIGGQNTFTLFPPIGSNSLDYCINENDTEVHHFNLGLTCIQCEP